MNKNIIIISFVIVLQLFLAGCASGGIPSCIDIVPPKITLTGEKTALENQIIGEYSELEEDAWLLSSVKSNSIKNKNTSLKTVGDPLMFEAYRIREFHSEKIRIYKNEGAIGENRNGYIQYIPVSKYENDSNEKKVLTTLVNEENRVRNIIFKRSLVLEGNQSPTKSQIDNFGKEFARQQYALALKDDKVQNNNGIWVNKK